MSLKHFIYIIFRLLTGMKKIKYLYILIGLLFIAQCSYMGKLSIPIQDYNGDKLKFDGFYCNVKNKNNQEIMFFYKDGFIHNYSTDNYKKEFLKHETCNIYELPYFWGVYVVDNNHRITIEYWLSNFEYSTLKYFGNIINDSTIVFDHPSISISKDTFYYYKCDWKPDSSKITFKDKIRTSWKK